MGAVPPAVTANVDDCPATTVWFPGWIVIIGGERALAGNTSMPFTLGLCVEPGRKLTLRVPFVTVTLNVFTTGMFIPPAAEQISKLVSTCVRLVDTLKMLCSSG